jgi:ABC-type enterochelin transport system ATPase subunit
MIQVNNLSKKYNGTTVLNIENLEIPKDKVWVLWEITVPVKQPFLV